MKSNTQTFRQPEPLSQKDLYNKALNYLSRREYSRLELQRKLAPYSDNQDDITAVLDRLSERNLQSDERFSENFIHSKQNKYGTQRMIETLKQKGVALSSVSEFLPNQAQQLATAIAILHKKLGTPRPLTANERQKAYRFLQYRGFTVEIIKMALRKWQNNEDD